MLPALICHRPGLEPDSIFTDLIPTFGGWLSIIVFFFLLYCFKSYLPSIFIAFLKSLLNASENKNLVQETYAGI